METENLREIADHGQDAGCGNLLGIQPHMRGVDYASEETFYKKLKGYFQVAAQKGWIGERTIAVLPEYLGTWLVAAGESPAALSAPAIQGAMTSLVLRHALPFASQVLRAKEADRVKASLFRLKAGEMARIYQTVFSRLAKEYKTTIVAGSILLPEPRVKDGQITPTKGHLYNTSFVFRPDGAVEPRFSLKIFPIQDELPFVATAPLESLPVFDTPAGKLGVLVCADSWYPEPYQRLKDQGVELIAVPSASSPAAVWDQPWGGYSGFPAPADVDTRDYKTLTERQAWGKYALAGRIGCTGARAGINLFLYGDLWDLDFGGGHWRLVKGELNIEGGTGPALINLWL
jgi:hypothetical protein